MFSYLPQGEQAALLPGASYSLPGLFLYSDLVFECLDQVREKFQYQIPVKYLYGSPQVKWNCGRLLLVDHGPTREAVEAELRLVRERGVLPLLTFSMPNMTERDLEDARGNEILALLHELGGGVILSSPLLYRHIRENYPNVECHASVIQVSFQQTRDVAYYEGLARDYSRYVVHPDDNFQPDFLRKLPKAQAEIMVNERCVYQCRQRAEHYLANTIDQAAVIDGTRNFTNFLDRCPNVPNFKQRSTKERTVSLTIQEIQDLRAMGFDLFKLQGRLDIPYVFFFDLLRYTLENTLAFPAMYPVFCHAIREHLKAKERRKRL